MLKPGKEPWEGYVKPGRIFGNLYFVGTKPASTHIIDTGEGLILIDPGYQASLYMVINNIWELGFTPKDIKHIVLSHGHGDHVNGTRSLVEMTGAKVFLAKSDIPILERSIENGRTKPFTPDVLIEDGDVITLGNTNIECMSTPGHTDGTMSLFFDVTDGKNTYRAGMFGGAGTNTLTREAIERINRPVECRQQFFDSIAKLEKVYVDINVGNHVGQNNTVGKLKMLESSPKENPFINPGEWKEFLAERRAALQKIIEEEKE